MAYGIGRGHRIGKQNRKQLDNINDPSLESSTSSYSYDKLNENTDITTKKSYTEERYYRTIFIIGDNTSDIILKLICIQPVLKRHIHFEFLC